MSKDYLEMQDSKGWGWPAFFSLLVLTFLLIISLNRLDHNEVTPSNILQKTTIGRVESVNYVTGLGWRQAYTRIQMENGKVLCVKSYVSIPITASGYVIQTRSGQYYFSWEGEKRLYPMIGEVIQLDPSLP